MSFARVCRHRGARNRLGQLCTHRRWGDDIVFAVAKVDRHRDAGQLESPGPCVDRCLLDGARTTAPEGFVVACCEHSANRWVRNDAYVAGRESRKETLDERAG